MKTNYNAKRLITLLILISSVVFITGCIEAKQKSPLKLDLAVLPLEETNGENFAEVTLTVQSETDMQNVTGEITLEEGLELVDGNTHWQTGHIQANQPQEFKITVKTPQKGEYKITASTADTQTSTKFSAEPETRAEPGKVYETEDEYRAREEARRKNPNVYEVCDAGCWVPEPLKGKELNDYFKSLNLQEDSVYVIIRFELLDLQAPEGYLAEYFVEQRVERDEILKNNGVVLYGYGDLEGWRYAKVPKKFLEEQHYDFIRWIGIKSPERKLQPSLREKILGKNCTGRVDVNIFFYSYIENIPDFKTKKEQLEQIINPSNILGYGDSSISSNIDISIWRVIALLGFVQEIGVHGFGGSEDYILPDPFENVTCVEV